MKSIFGQARSSSELSAPDTLLIKRSGLEDIAVPIDSLIRARNEVKLRKSTWRSVERLTLEIRDDGCGFESRNGILHRGAGLLGIRERVSRLGGTMTIEGHPGEGTRLMVSLPVGAPMVTTERVATTA